MPFILYQKPSVEEVDEDSIQPKAIPKKASQVIELADGSDNEGDAESDTEINSSEDESRSESAKDELRK